MSIHLLGIRHHGPGSCRNVQAYLQELQPDLILLEGPPEAEILIPGVLHEEMKPPVALLAYNPDMPRQAVFYPFAEFSPEWQTLKYAQRNSVPLRFFDLPLTYSFALMQENTPEEGENEIPPEETELLTDETGIPETGTEEKAANDPEHAANEAGAASGNKETTVDTETDTAGAGLPEITRDPFTHLARAAGYDDGELWWEMNVEQRQDCRDIFPAVQEAVTALRENLPERTCRREQLREAWMRKMLRAAQKEGFERIAVVCGAWHVPALANMPKQKEDNELLKGLAKAKTACTWIPWTYDRLSFRSGYGAGIESPGWYDHLWNNPADDGTLWMSRIASLLREKSMDISVAHVIEAVRLANATAMLRGFSRPCLQDFYDAVTTVMGFGDSLLLQIIKEELVISNRIGSVPPDVPKVPLLIDVEKWLKRLRISLTAGIKELVLDLRKPADLEKSILFHRLRLMGVDLATLADSSGKGTFKENWTLYYRPEHTLAIIEKAVWGNTLEEAATAYLSKQTGELHNIPQLVDLLSGAIPADLPALVEVMTRKLDSLSAASRDMLEMMRAVPGLVSIVRYGNVRNLDYSTINAMLNAMLARIMAGGLLICIHIDEEAAQEILTSLIAVDYAVATANQPELTEMWNDFIGQIRRSQHAQPLLSGYCTRLLNDKGMISFEEMETTLSFYSSVGNAPANIAYWFEGFLKSSGTILLLDDNLWNLVNNWVSRLDDTTFTELLPILKRTFSEFSAAERRKIGEKAKYSGNDGGKTPISQENFNAEAGTEVIPLIRQLLGLA